MDHHMKVTSPTKSDWMAQRALNIPLSHSNLRSETNRFPGALQLYFLFRVGQCFGEGHPLNMYDY
jgi:hypothetical protein